MWGGMLAESPLNRFDESELEEAPAEGSIALIFQSNRISASIPRNSVLFEELEQFK